MHTLDQNAPGARTRQTTTPRKRKKLVAPASGMPEMIVSSNIGGQSHLAAGAQVRVTHWIVALDERLAEKMRA